jgi:hypothetical protein
VCDVADTHAAFDMLCSADAGPLSTSHTCSPAGDIRDFYNNNFMPVVEGFVRSSIMGSSRTQQGSGGPAGQPSSSHAPAAQPVAVIPAVAVEAEAALTTKATRAAARRAVLATISAAAAAAPGTAASAGKAADREAMQQQHQQPTASPHMPAHRIQPLPPQALAIQEAIAMDVDDASSHAAQPLQQAVPAKPSPQAPASSPAGSVRRSIGAIAAAAGSAAAAAARAFTPHHAIDATRVAAATGPAQPGYGVTILDQYQSFQGMPSRPRTAGRGAAATAHTAITPKLQVRADPPDDNHRTSGHPPHLPADTIPDSGHPSPFPYQGAPPATKPATATLGFKTRKSSVLVDADIGGITNKENAEPHRSSMAAKAVAAAASARKAAAGFSSGRKGAGGSWLKSLVGVAPGTGSGHHLPSRFSIPGAGPSGMYSAGKQHLLHHRFQQHATHSPGLPPATHAASTASDFVDTEEGFSAMDYQADAQHVQPAHLAYSPLASCADAAAAAAVQAAPTGMLAMGSSPAVVGAMPWALPAIMEEGAQRRPLGPLSVAQANAFRNIR